MNALQTLAGRRPARSARLLALAALAALLALAAALALSALQPAGAQTTNNAMQTGENDDRTNFRLELSLIDDSDDTVPAGSSARIKAVIKFDVPSGKTGEGVSSLYTPDAHGTFGDPFFLQAGGTLRIAGPYEWENAGGRTLRIDPERLGRADRDPASYHANCQDNGADVDDFDDTNGYIIYHAWGRPQDGGHSSHCTGDLPTVNPPDLTNDWKSLYSGRGLLGDVYGSTGAFGLTGSLDYLPDRTDTMGAQGPCLASTADDVTTWSCEIILVDDQFGWRGHDEYSDHNGDYDAMIAAEDEQHLRPRRWIPNAQDASITIPRGTPDGSFTVSASIQLHSAFGLGTASMTANTGEMTLTDSLAINIGTVAEAQTATLDFATQGATDAAQATVGGAAGQPWPAIIAASDTKGTQLSLSILNENGKPSASGSVSTILLNTNMGRLASVTPSVGECVGAQDGLACQIMVSQLNTSNTGDIRFRVLPPSPAKAGVAMVRGTVLNASGTSFSLGPIEITFTGTASAMTLTEPASSILNKDTAGDDTRDRLRLSVSAADASGNRATVPTSGRRTIIKDPDGKTVNQTATGIQATWPLQDGADTPADLRDAAGNLQVEINVGSATALKTGVYTIEVRAGSLKQTQSFTVAGEAAAITVAVSESDFAPNARFTLTATVSNADGSAVPDGTPVVWADPQPAAKLVAISKQAATKDGQAAAQYVVIGEGRAWVTLTSGAGTGFWSENVGTPAAPPEPTNPADNLSGRAGFASYLGETPTSASALLAGLGNVTAIRIWQPSLQAWTLYAVVDGVSPPGSEDFAVSRGAVLWIGG